MALSNAYFASLGLPEHTAHGQSNPPNRRMRSCMSGVWKERAGDRSAYADWLAHFRVELRRREIACGTRWRGGFGASVIDWKVRPAVNGYGRLRLPLLRCRVSRRSWLPISDLLRNLCAEFFGAHASRTIRIELDIGVEILQKRGVILFV